MLRPGGRRFDPRCQVCRQRRWQFSFHLSIFSIPGSCCTRMTGLCVAVFPPSNKWALVLHREWQLHKHGLGLSRGHCVFVRCSVSALPLVRPVVGGQPHWPAGSGTNNHVKSICPYAGGMEYCSYGLEAVNQCARGYCKAHT